MPVNTDPQKIKELLERGVENIYPKKEFLESRLKSGEQLTLYTGYDPTAPTLHIGHGITMLKLRQFQDLGHKIIMLIGDFTGMIGDPTDKTSARQKLTRKQVLENCKNYKKQAAAVLNFSGKNPVQVKFNSKWLAKMSFADVVELSSHFTVQRMMERDMFENRIKEEKPIYLHEFLYPLMQGISSVGSFLSSD
jgi:tyrosyl-tRNA synthetase